MTRLRTVVLALLLTAASAQAQSLAPGVWRCGADGRSYSDTPCPGGLEVAVADPRSGPQVQAAQAAAARDRRLAEQLVREREQRDRLAQARFATPRPTPIAAAAKSSKEAARPSAAPRKAKRPAPPDDGTWRAVVPASRKTKG